MNALYNFFYMGGYGWYIWISYGSVLGLLFWHWLVPWRRWKKYLRSLNHE